ncbi:GAF and ANTAR domain-containing protein [Pseudonocardia abyssalis]|uniref:GAF and ANTAR domain-containing protein n=1 Tax=Pseudonocardia abyssalis TaxID=2792008 RepID=A0ABS6USR4_9PSEU|nr:GAF and ANTAR domain-containing protein [Pseudonocardia abyssalis]MBW0117211.1 GAF and ANTAR domain-containing protein [Pseudonocardia abyssalis]MBW0135294.1 GAF and ANTAR domain-containing protein [Pseudonocardia abyssalis]
MSTSPDTLAPPLDQDGIWSVADHIARGLRVEHADLPSALGAIIDIAVATVPGTTCAGIIVADTDRHLTPMATAGSIPLELDELQGHLGHGPCLTAARKQVVVHIEDMATDHRWPDFRGGARDLGVASMLCLPLHIDARCLGALSLYATSAGAFDHRAELVAQVLATQAVLTLAERLRTDQLRAALDRRDVIGQAKGILMERHRITADAAFARLSAASQSVNRKLVVVAEQLVSTGALPG